MITVQREPTKPSCQAARLRAACRPRDCAF